VSSRSTFSSIIGVALDAAPGRTMAVTSGYLALPNAFHVAWRTVAMDGTTVLGEGVMFALLASDGRIAEAVYFDGAVP
jgi:hypothetical protein